MIMREITLQDLQDIREPFPLILWLKTLSAPQECPVWLVTPQGRFGLRLLPLPLPAEQVEQARRRAR